MSLCRTWLVLGLFLLAGSALAASDPVALGGRSDGKADPPGRLYELHFESAYAEGCVGDLCDCAVTVQPGMKGSFLLRPDGGPREYALERVELLTTTALASKRFAGGGRYVIDERLHRMTLELTTAGGEPIDYDSGWLERPRNTEGIVIVVPMADASCWGNEFAIVARPYEIDDVEQGTLEETAASLGTIKARW